MTVRTLTFLAILLTGTGVSNAQEVRSKTPKQLFEEVREYLGAGSLEVAADLMKDFLALKPTPQDYLDLEAKYGPTTFSKLKAIPRWYDDSARNAAFTKDVIDKIVAAASTANESLLRNPRRVERFVRNLGSIPEEYGFALQELKRSGDFVVPFIVEGLRVDADPNLRAGILRAIAQLGPETIPGLLIASEKMSDEFKLMLIEAIGKRPDYLSLINTIDTNPLPYLWYLSAISNQQPNPLRDASIRKLNELYASAYSRRDPVAEITAAGRAIYERKGRFKKADVLNDSKTVKSETKLWTWDDAKQTLRETVVPTGIAEEAYALKYFRWALERNPGADAAQDLLIAMAVEKAVERAKFNALAGADPNAYQLLAAAPTATLVRLLDSALAEKRTALALGLVQALGDHADAKAANVEQKPGGGTRTPVLVKALAYDDPRVQIAAALSLLKIPNANHGANARIVEVLKRAVVVDGAAGISGKALVADGSTVRGDQIAGLLRQIGYQAEVVGNGRQLAKRIDAAADFDLVLIDRHIVNPTLPDLIPMLRGDVNLAHRPLLIVASPDARAPVPLETLLARLAALITATETQDYAIPPIPEADRRKTVDEIERNRKAIVDQRDRLFKRVLEARLARMTRLVDAANLNQTPDLKRRLNQRLPQLIMAGIVAEYDLTKTSAPIFLRDFEQLTDLIARQTELDASVRNIDSPALVRLIQQLESVLTPELLVKFNAIRGRMDDEALAIAVDSPIDAATAHALFKITKSYPGVAVIREPFSKVGFEQDLASAMPDASQRPRDPAEKAAAAKSAVEALRRMATGELAGYDLGPAIPTLRAALANDQLATIAADALANIKDSAAQTDLVLVAANAKRPDAVRLAAADAAVRNVQAFGKSATSESANQLATAPAQGALKSGIGVLKGLLTPPVLAEVLRAYRPTPASAKKDDAPKADPKKDEPKPMEEK